MLKTKMNPEVKQKWIDALRSGKYEQGSEKLRSVSGYCCLGVLCDLYAQEHDTQWEFTHPMDYWYFGDRSEYLPEPVMDWAGLNSHNPKMRVDVDEECTWPHYEEIANLNDRGYTFNDLSNMIEDQL